MRYCSLPWILLGNHFGYNSGTNDQWLNVEQLRALIRRHVDANFKV